MFINRTSNEILNDIADKLTSDTITNKAKTPGAKVRALVAAISDEIGSVYNVLDKSITATFIAFASGKFLDYMGAIFNLKRIEASGAEIKKEHKVFKFYVLEDGNTFGSINDGNDIIIPAGTELRSLSDGVNTVKYVLTEDVTCAAGDSYVWVSAKSVEVGEKNNVGANTIKEHNFTNYKQNSRNSLQVTNVSAIVQATDYETDDHYRYRIIKQATSGEKANETAVRLALLSLPGVSDVYIDDLGRGIGSFVVYVKPVIISAGNDLLEACKEQIKLVKGAGISYIVRYPKRLGIEMELSITFRDNVDNLTKSKILKDVNLKVLDYLANFDRGDEFVVNEVVERVMSTSNKIKDVGNYKNPIDALWVWKDTIVEDGRYRQVLLGNLPTHFDEIIVYEYTIDNPIRVTEKK